MNKSKILAYAGIVLVLLVSFVGAVVEFPYELAVKIVSYTIGFTLAIMTAIGEYEIKKDWKFYLTVLGLVFGSIMAVIGGVTQDGVLLIVGSAFAIVSVFFGVKK